MTIEEPSSSAGALRAQLSARFYGPLVTYFYRRLKDHELARDLTQEVMVRVIAAAARERIDNPESFVFRIAANLLHDRKRRHLRAGEPDLIPLDEALEKELEANLVEDTSPERVFLVKESLYTALRRLDALDKRTRNIFILFRLENMKQKDIAKLYGIGQSTVEKHVMKATLHLMKRHGQK